MEGAEVVPWNTARQAAAVLAFALGLAAVVASVMLVFPVPGRGAETNRPGDPADGDLTFVDVAGEVGLDFRHGAFRWEVSDDPQSAMGSGLCWIDFDDDGWLDLYVVNNWTETEWDRWQAAAGVPTSQMYRNERGSFVDVTEETGSGLDFHGQGCVAADFDDDGNTDLYVTSTQANAMLWNTGDNKFVEGAEAAGIEAEDWSTGAAAGDVNGDGFVDLFVAGYAGFVSGADGGGGFPASAPGVRDRLFLNLGDRQFVDAAGELGIDAADQAEHGVGGALVDIDRDRDLDLVVVNDTDPNRLYLNELSSRALRLEFVDASEQLGVVDIEGGLGVAIGDHNGDTWPDMVFAGRFGVSLLESEEFGFLDTTGSIAGPSDGAGGAGVNWADFDLDADLDLLVTGGSPPAGAGPISWYAHVVKSGEIRYLDQSTDVGLDAVGSSLGRASAVADYDNDGDLDVAISSVGGPLILLSNRGAAGHWLAVDLGNDPPGTTVEAFLSDGSTLVRQVIAGAGYLSSDERRVFFGLGRVDRVQTLTIIRPGGTKTVYEDLRVDRYLDTDT